MDQIDEHCAWNAPGHANCKVVAFWMRNFLELWPCMWKPALFLYVVRRARHVRRWRPRDGLLGLVLLALALGPGPWGDRRGMRRIAPNVYV